MQQLYNQLGITDRMTSLVPTMICQVNKVPKLRCSAAQVRAMVPICKSLAVAWLDASPTLGCPFGCFYFFAEKTFFRAENERFLVWRRAGF